MFVLEINALYKSAKEYAEKIKNEKPEFISESDSALCLIVTDKQDIFSGVTSVVIKGGSVEVLEAECCAIMSMRLARQASAKQMITVLFKDFSVVKPSDAALELLLGASAGNVNCEVAISPEEASTVMTLQGNGSADGFFGGFGEEPSEESVGAPADFSSGFKVDESNPFYEPDTPVADKAPEVLQKTPSSTLEEVPKTVAEPVVAGSSFDDDEEEAPKLSKADILKQAKKRKKVAKANFNFRKKM